MIVILKVLIVRLLILKKVVYLVFVSKHFFLVKKACELISIDLRL